MRSYLIAGGALLGAASLLALGAPTNAQTAAPPAFAACKACHSVEKGGPNRIGPNLYKVVGRPAASAPGYTYSPALKASKLTWDPATLDQFLAAPMKKVPGTKMVIGIADPAKRAQVIAYLRAEGAK